MARYDDLFPATLDDKFRESMRMHELVLERKRFAMGFAVSDRFDRHEYRVELERQTRIQLSCDLFCRTAEHVESLPSFEYPADWWQAFKARWFPRWAKRRWPVKIATVGGGKAKIDVAALFPELRNPHMGSMRIMYRPDHLRVLK